MTSSTILLGLNAQQLASLALIAAMLALFVWDRWRYDVVATMVLLAAVVIGLVPADKAFDGFSDPIIPIIASVMVVSRAISASGVLDHLLRRMLRRVSSASGQVGILTACVTFLSAFIKNIGTLGIFMPIAIQAARKSNRSSSIYLMPLAFGSLIGGTITLIGTSPNLLISSIRADQGKPGFGLFDFAWVGLPLSVLAIMFLAVGWRLLPKDRKGTRSPEEQFEIESYTIELAVSAIWKASATTRRSSGPSPAAACSTRSRTATGRLAKEISSPSRPIPRPSRR